MAQNASDNLIYFLETHQDNLPDLATIRHWSNLKMAYDATSIWVKDFDYAQVHSVTIKSIPFKKLYEGRDSKLFPLGSLLPVGSIPNVLWTAIDRAIPITLPAVNHNFFGIDEQIEINLVPTEQEHPIYGICTTLDQLASYIETAPSIRLKNLNWVVLSSDAVLIVGEPLLPISGAAVWKQNNHLLPAGYNFEFPLLAEMIYASFNLSNPSLILWNESNLSQIVPLSTIRPLSVSSVRNTIANLFRKRFE